MYKRQTAAIYEIYVKNEDGQSQKTTVVHDQSQNTNGFHTIATLDLPAGSNCSVILRDFVGGESSGSFVVFDAIRFTSAGTVSTVNGDVDHTFPEYLSINKVFYLVKSNSCLFNKLSNFSPVLPYVSRKVPIPYFFCKRNGINIRIQMIQVLSKP